MNKPAIRCEQSDESDSNARSTTGERHFYDSPTMEDPPNSAASLGETGPVSAGLTSTLLWDPRRRASDTVEVDVWFSPMNDTPELSTTSSAHPTDASPLTERESLVAGAFARTARIREPAPA